MRYGNRTSGILGRLTDSKAALEAGLSSAQDCRCSHSAGEKKRVGSPERCQWLRNDIKDGNRSRWRAWHDLTVALNQVSAKTRSFAKQKEREGGRLAVQALYVLVDAGKAAVKRSPRDAAEALAGAVAFLRGVSSYFGDYEAEYRRFIRADVLNAESKRKTAEYMDRIFQEQDDAFQKEGCGRLYASDFNRPGAL